jgi:hypothetical protein
LHVSYSASLAQQSRLAIFLLFLFSYSFSPTVFRGAICAIHTPDRTALEEGRKEGEGKRRRGKEKNRKGLGLEKKYKSLSSLLKPLLAM